jgi:hypothetical protein
MRNNLFRKGIILGILIVFLFGNIPLTQSLDLTKSPMNNINKTTQNDNYPQRNDWWNRNWNYRKQITIDHTLVEKELTNFPVLVQTTSLDFVNHVQNDGDDFVFTNDDNIQLNHEIESYNSTTGSLTAWVNITLLSDLTDTTFWLYYGNPFCDDQQNIHGTWDSQYQGVWHLNNNPSGYIYDSTTYGNDGICHGSMDASDLITGRIGPCLIFDGTNDYVSITDSPSLKPTNLTLSAWFCPQQIKNGEFISKASYDTWYNADGKTYAFNANGDATTAEFEIDADNQNTQIGQYPMLVNNWCYLTLTFNTITQIGSFYANGNLRDSKVCHSSVLWYYKPWDLNLGACRYGTGDTHVLNNFFNCKLDEIRVMNIPIDPDWVATEYNNQNDPASFMSIGNEEKLDLPHVNFTYTPANPVTTTLISFIDCSTVTNATIVYWWWDFGDSYFSNLQHPFHCYNTNGSFNVTLIVIDDGGGTNSTMRTISVTNAPNTPNNPSPVDGDQNIPLIVYLSWSGGDPDEEDTVTYDVYFGTSNLPELVSSNQGMTTYAPGELEYSTTYYWQIIAHDNNNHTTSGSLWYFITQPQPNQPPYPPSNPTPFNGATDIPLNTTMNWVGGDPDPDDDVTYDVYFGTTTPPPKIVENQTMTFYTPTVLDDTTIYYWQIIAWDSQTTSSEGPIWEFTTIYDTNPPVTTISIQGNLGDNNWYISPVTITLTAIDDLNNINQTLYQLDSESWNTYTTPFTVSDDNEHIIHYYSIDNHGNTEQIQSATFNIDQAPPVTTHSFTGDIGDNGWCITSGTLFLNAMDNTSGVNHTYFKINDGEWIIYSTPVILDSDGEHVLKYYSIDLAGNTEQVKGPYYFKIDTTPPSISLSKEKTGFNQVTFTADVNDSGSGINYVEFTLDGVVQINDTQEPYEYIWTGTGNHQVTATAFDLAGNSQSQSMSTPVEFIQAMSSIQFQRNQQLLKMN